MDHFNLRADASKLAQAMGIDAGAVLFKIKESRACGRQTRMPAYDVFIKPLNGKRGKHLFTIVYPDWEQLNAEIDADNASVIAELAATVN